MSSSTLPALPDSDAESDHSTGSLVLPFTLEQDPKRTDQYRTTEKRRRLNIYWDYSIDTLNALDVPDTNNGDWVAAEHSQTTFTRLFPVIKKSKFDTDYKNYKLLFAFQGTENGVPYIKGALQHRKTGKIVMLTATTKPRAEIKEGKPKPSRAEGWHVYGVHMTAPPCFWRAFKAC
jgi:hypothetical protein